ncbi:MAG: hypothetical protein V4608_10895 [Bacteroidota bacterium]
METTLNINNLTNKAIDLIYDGDLLMAERAEIPIQEIEIEGKKFKITLVAEAIN